MSFSCRPPLPGDGLPLTQSPRREVVSGSVTRRVPTPRPLGVLLRQLGNGLFGLPAQGSEGAPSDFTEHHVPHLSRLFESGRESLRLLRFREQWRCFSSRPCFAHLSSGPHWGSSKLLRPARGTLTESFTILCRITVEVSSVLRRRCGASGPVLCNDRCRCSRGWSAETAEEFHIFPTRTWNLNNFSTSSSYLAVTRPSAHASLPFAFQVFQFQKKKLLMFVDVVPVFSIVFLFPFSLSHVFPFPFFFCFMFPQLFIVPCSSFFFFEKSFLFFMFSFFEE